MKNPVYLLVESNADVNAALERFSYQPSSASFTDYLVMTLADRFQTKLIFGFDEVFRKNGDCLPEASEKEQAA